MMDRIIAQTEADPNYRDAIDAVAHAARGRRADAIGCGMRADRRPAATSRPW